MITNSRQRLWGPWLLAVPLAVAGCMKGPGFLKQNTVAPVSTTKVVETQESNGGVTGALDPASIDTQVIQASSESEIAGAAVEFPPGAIAVATDVTVAPGGELANESTLDALDLGQAGLEAAAPSVAVTSSVAMDTQQPFTVSLPLPATGGLHLDDPFTNLVVIYKVDKNAAGDSFTGVYTRDMLEITGTIVKVITNHFGTFQAVITKVKVEAPVEKSQTVIVAETKAKEEAKQEEQLAKRQRTFHYFNGFMTTSFGEDVPSGDGLRGQMQTVRPQSVKSGNTKLTKGLLSKTIEEDAP